MQDQYKALKYLTNDIQRIRLDTTWPKDVLESGKKLVFEATAVYPYVQAIQGVLEHMGKGWLVNNNLDPASIGTTVVVWLKTFPHIRPYADVHVTRGKQPQLYMGGMCVCLDCLDQTFPRVRTMLLDGSVDSIYRTLSVKNANLQNLRNFLRGMSNTEGNKTVTYGRSKLKIEAVAEPTATFVAGTTVPLTNFTADNVINAATTEVNINDIVANFNFRIRPEGRNR